MPSLFLLKWKHAILKDHNINPNVSRKENVDIFILGIYHLSQYHIPAQEIYF